MNVPEIFWVKRLISCSNPEHLTKRIEKHPERISWRIATLVQLGLGNVAFYRSLKDAKIFSVTNMCKPGRAILWEALPIVCSKGDEEAALALYDCGAKVTLAVWKSAIAHRFYRFIQAVMRAEVKLERIPLYFKQAANQLFRQLTTKEGEDLLLETLQLGLKPNFSKEDIAIKAREHLEQDPFAALVAVMQEYVDYRAQAQGQAPAAAPPPQPQQLNITEEWVREICNAGLTRLFSLLMQSPILDHKELFKGLCASNNRKIADHLFTLSEAGVSSPLFSKKEDLLTWAVRVGSLDWVKAIPIPADLDLSSLIVKACFNKNSEIARYLLKKQPKFIQEALYEAAVIGNLELVKELLNLLKPNERAGAAFKFIDAQKSVADYILDTFPEHRLDWSLLDLLIDRGWIDLFWLAFERLPMPAKESCTDPTVSPLLLRALHRDEAQVACRLLEYDRWDWKSKVKWSELATFILAAVKKGHLAPLQTMLDRLPANGWYDSTFVRNVVEKGKIEGVDLLLAKTPGIFSIERAENLILSAIKNGSVAVFDRVAQAFPNWKEAFNEKTKFNLLDCYFESRKKEGALLERIREALPLNLTEQEPTVWKWLETYTEEDLMSVFTIRKQCTSSFLMQAASTGKTKLVHLLLESNGDLELTIHGTTHRFIRATIMEGSLFLKEQFGDKEGPITIEEERNPQLLYALLLFLHTQQLSITYDNFKPLEALAVQYRIPKALLKLQQWAKKRPGVAHWQDLTRCKKK